MLLVENLVVSVVRVVWLSAKAVVGVVSLSQFTLMLLVENLIVSVVRVVWLSAKAVVGVVHKGFAF